MEYIKLGKLVKIQKGRKNEATETPNKDSTRIIQIQDLRNDDNLSYTNDDKGLLVDRDDVLIAWDGANAGLIGFGKTGFLGSTLSLLRKVDNSFYSEYLGRFLSTQFEYFQKSSTGATIPHISRNALEELEIPLPSYENQIRVANLLEKIESTIAERKNTIDLLDELVKTTFYQMFGDYKSISKSNLEFLGDNISYLTSGSRGWAKHYSMNGAKFLRIQNVGNGVIREDNLVYVNPPNSAEAKRTKVQAGDLVISITADLGRSSVIPSDFGEAYINQHLALIRLNKNINPIYAAWFFNMPFGNIAIRKKNRAAVKAGLNFDDINSFPILIPPIELQNQFAEIIQKIESIKAEQEAQLKGLEELYTSISYKVFNGEIDLSKVPFDASLVPNPNETPKKEPIEKPDVVEQEDVSKEEIEKVKSRENIKGSKFGFQVVRHLESWGDYSFKEIADSIIKHFNKHYFNAEMILNFLDKELDIQVNYYSSAEQKKNPQYQNADDFYRFIATALTGENIFLTLEQIFYNAETENIANISFTERDVENLSKKDKKERSGIYFCIKDETTTT